MREQMTPSDKMVSQRFGWLIVETPSQRRTPSGDAYWWCQCRCGNRVEVIGHNLRSGNTVSCGCLRTLLPAARRLIRPYRETVSRMDAEPDPQRRSEIRRQWEAGVRESHPRGGLILSLLYAHLIHGLPLSAMGFPLPRKSYRSPTDLPLHRLTEPLEYDGPAIIRRGRDPDRTDITYDGD